MRYTRRRDVVVEEDASHQKIRDSKRLRRYVYATVLFFCMLSALYSSKAYKNEQLNAWSRKALPKSEKVLTRLSRQAVDPGSSVNDESSTVDNITPESTTSNTIITSSNIPTHTTPTSNGPLTTDDSTTPRSNPVTSPSSTSAASSTITAKMTSTYSTETTMTSSVSPKQHNTSHDQITTNRSSTTINTPTTMEILCEPPAYKEFPDDLFSNDQRSQGFVIIHVLVGIYMFYALAVVCDDYFVASMDKICQKLGLTEDVAGATFMAAGSSAPELFASLLGVFVAKGDVGTGTIIGSAVFNILFVIGLCALFAGQVVLLSWWPLLRDSFCYSLSVVVLIAILSDSIVTWWESLIMLILYGMYIVVMVYNFKIKAFLTTYTKLRVMDDLTQSSQGILSHDNKRIHSNYVQFTSENNEKPESWWPAEDSRGMAVDEVIKNFPRKMTLYEAALKVMSSHYFRPITRFRSACKRIIIEKRYLDKEGIPNRAVIKDDYSYSNTSMAKSQPNEDWRRPPSLTEQGVLTVVKWFVTIPVIATLHYTIPDCRNPRWDRFFLLTFITAMLWIAFFSYILVWMVTLVGYTCGIPDTIMGITFLAAGTSVPDAYSSVLVAKQGMGDMAVSNSIGSNVFDILIGLALPWLLQTGMVNPNSEIRISSGGMVYNVILLFISIAATLISVHYCRWQLNKRLGILLLIFYAIFLVFSMLIEYNVFGFVNPPECEV